jgi:hypothetical protein
MDHSLSFHKENKMGASLTPAEQFALARAAFQLCEKVLPPQHVSPKILHAPIRDELLENRAVRATSILNSLLLSLAAREAIKEVNGTVERI